MKSQLDVIQSEAERLSSSSATELRQLRSDFVSLLQKLEEEDNESEVSSVSSTGTSMHQELFDSLNEISQNLARLEGLMKTTPREIRILEHLYYEGIFNRVDSIKKASEDTFEWILQSDSEFQEYLRHRTDSDPYRSSRYYSPDSDPELDESAPTRLRPRPEAYGSRFIMSRRYEQCMNDGRRRFQDWLSSDRGIFHISGKAGCGKSTLLKLIIGHEKTTEALERCARKTRLIVASFFFWRSDGNKHQMTLDGMRRSVLFLTLRQCPHLIPTILPQQWHHVSVNPSSRTLEAELFRASKINEAFDRLTALSTQSDGMNLSWCLFIDGLDEYDATDYDQRVFARGLRDWARSTSVKICVTSRPEVQFLDTFPSQTRIHLHDLTNADIYQSARCTFERDEVFPRISEFYLDLVERIVKSAEGVFLWAILVVGILITEASLHSNYTSLRAKLRSTPIQLDDLYDSLFTSMSRDDKRRAYFLLLLVATNPFGHNLNSTTIDYIDLLGNLKVGCHPPEYNYYIVAEDEERLSRQIQSLSRGLLVLSLPESNGAFGELGIKEIRFFHKTVKDYVLTPSRTTEFQLMFPKYDRYITHATLRMMEISRTPLWICTAQSLAEYFHRTLWPHAEAVLGLETMQMLDLVWREKFNSILGLYWIEVGLLEMRQATGLSNVDNPFLIIAVFFGHIQYLQQYLDPIENSATASSHGKDSASPVPVATKQGHHLLLTAILSLSNSSASRNNSVPMIEMLMAMGHSMKQQTTIRGGDAAGTDISRSVSLWILFVYLLADRLLATIHYGGGTDIPLQIAALETVLSIETQETAFILFQNYDRMDEDDSGGHSGATIYISTISDFATLCKGFQHQASNSDPPQIVLSEYKHEIGHISTWLKEETEFGQLSELQSLFTGWLKDSVHIKDQFEGQHRHAILRVLAVVTREESFFLAPDFSTSATLRLF